MIQVYKSTADKVGGCVACSERGAVKQITIGSERSTQTFRLCFRCEKELKQALKDAR